MIVVKFVRDCPAQSAFAGEEMGFPDEVAARLCKAGKAVPVTVTAPDPEPAAEAATVADEPAVAVEDEATDDGQDDADEPAPRRRGRPRKNAD